MRSAAAGEVHPAILAMFAVLAATATVILIGLAFDAVRRRRAERRWSVPDDVVIDLTFVEAAIEHDRELAAERFADADARRLV